jgi:hypothetical protein
MVDSKGKTPTKRCFELSDKTPFWEVAERYDASKERLRIRTIEQIRYPD